MSASALDLSFRPFTSIEELALPEPELAMLVAAFAARQQASVTARVQAELPSSVDYRVVDPCLFAPAGGAFTAPLAAAFIRWKEE